MVATTLQGIKGLGPARRDRLLEQFGSLDALRITTFDELASLAWLPNDVATRLYDHLQGPGQPRPTKGSEHDE